MRRWALALLVLLLVPGTAGQANQEAFNEAYWGLGAQGTTQVYLVDGFTTTDVGTHTEQVFSVRLDTRERVTNGTWAIIITATYAIAQTSVGTWQWQVSLDGVAITDCMWSLSTINTNAGVFGSSSYTYPNLQAVCRVDEPAYGVHDITITRSVATGTPAPITSAITSVNILNNDPVILSMPSHFEALTGLTALEFLIFPILAIVGLFLWTRQDLGVRLFGVFLVIFDMAIVYAFYASAGGDAWPGLFALVFILLLAAAWMVVQLATDMGKQRQARRGLA